MTLNTSKDRFSFFLEEDGIHGYFASNCEGGKGDGDIYRFETIDEVSFNPLYALENPSLPAGRSCFQCS
ncbi:hypothetical protein E9993_20255 [Labilibacter sediminis]|nr:hypothetical protein E9993_20255 [Labilibacter sediminis]